MLTRRMLIASTAVLAAGCGGPDISLPRVLGTPKITPLTWVSRTIPGLGTWAPVWRRPSKISDG